MNIEKIYGAYASPTGTTSKTVRYMLGNMCGQLRAQGDLIDFTLPRNREAVHQFGPKDLLVIGVPVYGGRIPKPFVPYIRENFKGTNTPAIPVVLFGNRAFDDALMELKLILEENGFIPVGAAAVVGKHSLSARLGYGRPNYSDFEGIRQFTETVTKAVSMLIPEAVSPLYVDGNPDPGFYTSASADAGSSADASDKPAAGPKVETDASLCTECGRCAQVCPLGSVAKSAPFVTEGPCMTCMACVNACRPGARKLNNEKITAVIAKLEETDLEPKESIFYTLKVAVSEPAEADKK